MQRVFLVGRVRACPHRRRGWITCAFACLAHARHAACSTDCRLAATGVAFLARLR